MWAPEIMIFSFEIPHIKVKGSAGEICKSYREAISIAVSG
jgi:hypothetical protein